MFNVEASGKDHVPGVDHSLIGRIDLGSPPLTGSDNQQLNIRRICFFKQVERPEKVGKILPGVEGSDEKKIGFSSGIELAGHHLFLFGKWLENFVGSVVNNVYLFDRHVVLIYDILPRIL